MFDKNDLKLRTFFWGQLRGFSHCFVFSNKNISMASVYRQGSRGMSFTLTFILENLTQLHQ